MPIEFAEMFLSGDATAVHTDKTGLVWKPVLRTGMWQVGPNAAPIRVIAERSYDPKSVIGMQDIVDNFDAGAVEHVTVPISHADMLEQNRGFVRQLKIAKTPTGHVLMAAHDITEPDTKGKIERGTIANTSVGLQFDYVRKEDGRKFPIVLKHVALTNRPWINKLAPFGVNASEDEYDVSSFEFSEPLETRATISIEAGDYTPSQLRAMLSEAENEDDSTSDEKSKSGSSSNVQPTLNQPEEIVPDTPAIPTAPATTPAAPVAEVVAPTVSVPAEPTISAAQFAEVESAAATSKAQLEAANQRLAVLEATQREADAESFLTSMRSVGLSEENGCQDALKVAREIMLADTGGTVVQLSEEGQEMPVSYTAGALIKRFVDALPTDEKTGKLKVQFSEQAVAEVAGEKPKAEADPEGDADPNVVLSEEDADKLFAEMFPGGVI